MPTHSALVTIPTAVAFLMLAPPIVPAQDDAGSTLVAPREGDIYGGVKHQPREPAASANTKKQVDDEVKALLKQSDELDRQSEQRALPSR